jgi:DDE superfamily endonuclease
VLAVVNSNLTFSYVLCGWEGCAHDSQVLQDALEKGFPRRNGKYFLGDAGYALNNYTLTRYRGVRYHLREWEMSNVGPQTAKELYNKRHRNVVERPFGILKKRFPIEKVTMPSYPMETQVRLVKSCFMVQLNQGFDEIYDIWGDDEYIQSGGNVGGNDNYTLTINKIYLII